MTTRLNEIEFGFNEFSRLVDFLDGWLAVFEAGSYTADTFSKIQYNEYLQKKWPYYLSTAQLLENGRSFCGGRYMNTSEHWRGLRATQNLLFRI